MKKKDKPSRYKIEFTPELLEKMRKEKERRQRERERERERAASLSPLEWAKAYRRIDGLPFSLKPRYQPLEEVYSDRHPYIALKKPAQKGGSEYAVTRACHTLDVGAAFYRVEKEALNVGYIFSTKEALTSFSKERFSSLRLESDHLSQLFTNYDAVNFKQAGKAFLYFAGGKSTKAMKSFAADDLIYDEFDEIGPEVIALAEARLSNSELAHRFKLSTPTYPGIGIDKEYQDSDQRVWEVLCFACGEFVELDFFRDVRADLLKYEEWSLKDAEYLSKAEMTIHCPVCQVQVDNFGPGRWRARFPERQRIRGYYLPPLSCGKVDLNRIAIRSVSPDPYETAELYRSDLGLAYSPKGARITDDMLNDLIQPVPVAFDGSFWRETSMGVDVGNHFHVRITSSTPDGRRVVRFMRHLASDPYKTVWEKLSDLMEEYDVRLCIIDSMPELHACREWAAQYPERVLRASYPTTANLKGRLYRKPAEEVDAGEVEVFEENVIQINRTMAMDDVYAGVFQKDELWPAVIIKDEEVRSHMKAPTRVLVANKEGQEQAVWVHTTRDDFFHATLYDRIAYQVMPKPLPLYLALGSVNGWGYRR